MAENEEGSSSGNSEQPIIIKKIKKGGHGHHGGAWKVAYADFVTAMMAFFIVMWILASSEEVKEGVSDYFNAPENYSAFTGMKTAPITLFESPVPPSNKDGDGDGTGEGTAPLSISFDSGKPTDSAKMNERIYQALKDSAASAQQLDNAGSDLKQAIEELNKNATTVDMKNILSAIEIEISKEGMKIELLESNDNNFFEVGSAKLKPAAVLVLKQLAQRIGTLPNYVAIEGHTDSRGYATKTGYSNWELSADRANSARKILETSGFWPEQTISVAGYADRRLRNPNNPFDYSNRRVSIIVKNLTASEFLNTNKDNIGGKGGKK